MKPKISDFKHIGIINTAFLGDVAISLDLTASIKAYHPDCKINFITTPAAADIASITQAIDLVTVFDKKSRHKSFSGMWKLAWEIKEWGAECIISAHKSARSAILTAMINPKFSVGFNNAGLSFLYRKRVKYNFNLHESDRLKYLLNAFQNYEGSALNNDYIRFNIAVVNKIEHIMSDMNNAKPLIIIAPGSVWATKRWGTDRFIKLAKMLKNNYKVALVGGKSDSDLIDDVAGKSGTIALAGKLSIPETIYLMTKAEWVITNDSAPTHFANLAGCKTATIYGPTSPIFGFYPMGKNDVVFQTELPCKPCSIHGGEVCPLGTHECMTSITPEMIIEKLKL